jgi:hypothetical protein
VLLYLLFNLCARWRWVVNPTPQSLYVWWRGPVTQCTRGWVGPSIGLDGCETSVTSAFHGIKFLDTLQIILFAVLQGSVKIQGSARILDTWKFIVETVYASEPPQASNVLFTNLCLFFFFSWQYMLDVTTILSSNDAYLQSHAFYSQDNDKPDVCEK